MEEFRYYSPEDVIYANLRETALRTDMLLEQELAHLRELAIHLTSDIADQQSIAATLRDLPPSELDIPIRVLEQNQKEASRLQPFRNTWKKVLLCMEILRQPSVKGRLRLEDFFSDADEIESDTGERIAYQRSSYADTAYLRFAEQMTQPRAFYTPSFPDACKEVYDGLCEYCILPIENSSEGILNSFTRLIDRFHLKIAAIHDVSATDGSQTTSFALLRRNLLPPSTDQSLQSHYFEFSIPLNSAVAPAEILMAAGLCGLTLYRMDFRPQAELPSQTCIHCVLRIEDGDILPFLLFLSMQVPLCDYIGFYPKLPSNTKKNIQKGT